MPYPATRISDLLAAEGADAALEHCLEALAQAPGDADLHHVHGRILNNLGRLPEALGALDRAVHAEPDNATMLAHRGHVLLGLQRIDEAASDFCQALALDSIMVIALKGLADIYLATGQITLAAKLFGRLISCEPNNHAHWLNLGLAQHEYGSLYEAEQALQAALDRAPGDADICCAMASVLQSQGRLEEAIEWFGKVMRMQPGHPQATAAIAGISDLQGEPVEAMAILRPALNGESGDVAPAIRLAAAQLLQKSGDTPEAEKQLAAVLKQESADGLQKSAAHFLRTTILDKKGEYAKAYAQAEKGNFLRDGRYEKKNQASWFSRSREVFSGDVLERLADAAQKRRGVIFVVGMPRTGTSLIEQILDCHSKVHGAGELDFVGRLAARLPSIGGKPRCYPECLHGLTATHVAAASAEIGASYATLAGSAAMVSDKMWQNFEFLGLIQLVLPGAKIIHCQRDPRDTGLSCFLQGFGVAGPPFSYSLSGIVHYYHQYRMMMDYWRRTLTLPILDVQYEKVVTNPEIEIRRLLEFLDLKWEPGCLEFHRNRRVVRTASSDQVRQPMYRSSVGRHSLYSEQLADFFAALQVQNDE